MSKIEWTDETWNPLGRLLDGRTHDDMPGGV